VNKIPVAAEVSVGSTLERAVDEWAARVFAELNDDNPRVAVYFDKPLAGTIFSHSHRSGDLKGALTPLLHRLSRFLQDPPRAQQPERDEPTAESMDDVTTMFAAKYAGGLLSAYRDIVKRGVALQEEIVEAEQSETYPSSDLAQAVGSWANRCVTFANDPKGPLTADQRRAFRASPPAPASFTTLASVVNANVAALRSVRDLFEP
jgi:hypothetical protein